jgi:8-oxo-dGTP pyrophosphatase MutT (NUDIX family)
MKEFIINDDNLKEEDVEMKVVRVKALILNSKGSILLAFNNNTYQFPGGHVDDDETIDECMKREIKEEVGIDVEVNDPFLSIETYDANYFGTGKKVLNTIYYYRIFTDLEPDFSKTKYDELELQTDFNLFYVDFSNLENFLVSKIDSNEIDPKIAREMIHVVKEYKKIYGE